MNQTNRYQFKTHGICPYNPRIFDYYDVTITSNVEIQIEFIEAVLDRYRGLSGSQEEMTKKIYDKLPKSVTVTLVGYHGSTLTVTRLTNEDAREHQEERNGLQDGSLDEIQHAGVGYLGSSSLQTKPASGQSFETDEGS